MAKPAFSVIVPVRNGGEALRLLLASLERQTLPPDRYEVIVVDNGSTDGSGEAARSAGATVVREPIPNRARARNRGASVASADRFAFIDADCIADEQWLAGFERCTDQADLLAGPVRLTTSATPNPVERFERIWRFDQRSWVEQGWAATANLLVARHAFEATEGFDPAYRANGEDADFCIRARRAGFSLGFCAAAGASHPGEDRLTALLSRSFWHGYGSAQAWRRIGAGYRAWRRPGWLVSPRRSAQAVGLDRATYDGDDWWSMALLAQASYASRVAGSIWSEIRRAR